jgi:hypothetical protein
MLDHGLNSPYSKANDRTRSENTKGEKVDHKGEAELQQATTKNPTQGQLAQ